MDLLNENVYFIIASAYSEKNDDYTNSLLTSQLEDRLYRNEFTLIPFTKKGGGKSFLAFKENATNNNELRYEAIEINDTYYQDSVYVKYYGECVIKKVLKSGSEINTKLTNYNDLEEETTFYNENYAFSLIDLQSYFKPQSKKDFKEGMVVEILNNKGYWIPREVDNVQEEWDNMYKLLIKYGRVRILNDLF